MFTAEGQAALTAALRRKAHEKATAAAAAAGERGRRPAIAAASDGVGDAQQGLCGHQRNTAHLPSTGVASPCLSPPTCCLTYLPRPLPPCTPSLRPLPAHPPCTRRRPPA